MPCSTYTLLFCLHLAVVFYLPCQAKSVHVLDCLFHAMFMSVFFVIAPCFINILPLCKFSLFFFSLNFSCLQLQLLLQNHISDTIRILKPSLLWFYSCTTHVRLGSGGVNISLADSREVRSCVRTGSAVSALGRGRDPHQNLLLAEKSKNNSLFQVRNPKSPQ
ncbi:hypothetical protein XENOCAPTIV_019068 [Xenoophorus captivus]|uniref:Uncharacterized protein n=1 Tax=Xenoophorus captivus TaxID=1517983 RepID=A0ABV0Q5G1_9TELE